MGNFRVNRGATVFLMSTAPVSHFARYIERYRWKVAVRHVTVGYHDRRNFPELTRPERMHCIQLSNKKRIVIRLSGLHWFATTREQGTSALADISNRAGPC